MHKKVLIIESDTEVVDQLKDFISPSDATSIQIKTAGTGQEGIEKCRDWQPTCVVADIRLPDMTGAEFVTALGGEKKILPCAVVMIRRPGEEPRAFEAIKLGAQDCVVMGRLTAQGMTRAVERSIEKFELQKELQHQKLELEEANQELLKARDYLEDEVSKRTEALERSNDQLKGEITERKTIEENLKASEERYIALVANVPGAIYSCSNAPERKVVFLSSFIEQITGFHADDFMEKKTMELEDIIHPDDRKEVADKLRHQLETQGHYALEYRVVHRNGTNLWVLDKGRQILNENGKVVSLEGIIFDITERRHLEEERLKTSKLESIGLLAGGVAHDLNNILTAISANVQLGLIENERGQNVEVRLQNANAACNSAADLAKQLLTFAKGGAPIRKPTDVGDLVKTTVAFSLHGSKVISELQIPDDLHWSEVDDNQIGQVVNNLVINADQSMPVGGRLFVRLSNYQQVGHDKLNLPPGPYVRISVEDEGAGIPPELLSKIFDPYFTTKKHGSGLGLATSYSIIKRHRGLITVQSEVGKGTKFDIYLPALLTKSEQVEKAPESQLKGGHRVLFMDDNELIRMAVSNLLGTMGYHVSLASHGEEAMMLYRQAIINEKPFDFVMLDLTVPGGMGGKETIKQLRQINPNIIAIVVSGYSDDALMADCRAHGFRASLTKPFTLQAVKEVLAQIEGELENGGGKKEQVPAETQK